MSCDRRSRARRTVAAPASPVDDSVGEWTATGDAAAPRCRRRTSRGPRDRARRRRWRRRATSTASSPRRSTRPRCSPAATTIPGHTEMLAALTGSTRRDDARVDCEPTAARRIRCASCSRRRTSRCATCRTRSPREAIAAAARRDARRAASTGSASTTPRIALCALNPHAGDGGRFGTEDDTILRPPRDARASRVRFRPTRSSCARCAASSTPSSRRITTSA